MSRGTISSRSAHFFDPFSTLACRIFFQSLALHFPASPFWALCAVLFAEVFLFLSLGAFYRQKTCAKSPIRGRFCAVFQPTLPLSATAYSRITSSIDVPFSDPPSAALLCEDSLTGLLKTQRASSAWNGALSQSTHSLPAYGCRRIKARNTLLPIQLPSRSQSRLDQYIGKEGREFEPDSFRRKKLEGVDGVSIIIGRLKKEFVPEGHDPRAMVFQAYRFARKTERNPDGWTMERAKEWIKEHEASAATEAALRVRGGLAAVQIRFPADLCDGCGPVYIKR